MKDLFLHVLSSPLLQSQSKLALLKEGVKAHGRFCKCPLSSSGTPCTSVLTHIQAFHGSGGSQAESPQDQSQASKAGLYSQGEQDKKGSFDSLQPPNSFGVCLVL